MKQQAAFFIGMALFATSLFGEVVYSSIETPLPPGEASVGFSATSASEFGNAVNLAGTDRTLTAISVVMANWSYQSEYLAYEAANPTLANSTGFYVPLTMNLYNLGAGGAVGSSIATTTINAFIAWRPEPNPSECPGTTYQAYDASCNNSATSVVTFNFTGDGVTLPDSLIWGLAYNTSNSGYAPVGNLGYAAPYDSLNIGVDGSGTPSVGSDVYPGSVYWNTSNAGFLTSPGPGVAGTFSQDTVWAPYDPNVQIDAVAPEPGTFVLMGGSVVVLVFAVRRRKALGMN